MSAGGSGSAGTATSALCLLLSLTAVAVCLLLGAKTAELQGRLAALEERGAAGPGPLLDALQPRVEQLLREVSAAGLGSGLPGGRLLSRLLFPSRRTFFPPRFDCTLERFNARDPAAFPLVVFTGKGNPSAEVPFIRAQWAGIPSSEIPGRDPRLRAPRAAAVLNCAAEQRPSVSPPPGSESSEIDR